jgi:predicted membrane protein
MPDVHGIASQIFPNNALGLTIAAIVFFIAVIFIIRSLFAVIFTAILLFVAYISGEAIATNSLFKGQRMQNIEDLRKENPEKTEAKPAEKPEVKPAEPSK